MQHDFPYTPGYIGELNAFSPLIAADLERLLKQLNPELASPIRKQRLAFFQDNHKFRQIIAVETLNGRPSIVGTANISLLEHSYDKDAQLIPTPSLILGSFVVDEQIRGKGIATRIWERILETSTAENIHCLQFTSNPSRGAAHNFYAKMSAVPVAPVMTIKIKADGTEIQGNTPPYDEQFELAKGKIASIFSETGAEPLSEQTARHIIAKSGAELFEQLIPVTNTDKATSVLFSIEF